MVQLNFRTKRNGVPILSKREIEDLAEIVLIDYDKDIIYDPKPSALDIDEIVECYAGLEMDYQDLTHDQSILGMTVFNDSYIPVYDAEEGIAKEIPVDKGTVLIDNSLLEESQLKRGRFTLSHELSHWLLHRQIYTINPQQLSLFDFEEDKPLIMCRTTDIESNGRKELITDDDWIEWQADYMASTIIMPRRAFSKVARERFDELGIEGEFEHGSNFRLDLEVTSLIYDLSNILDVSLSAAEIRLKNLGFITETLNQ